MTGASLLSRVLWADASISAAAGLGLVIGATWLEPLPGLPQPLLRNVGLLLWPFAALVLLAATRSPVSKGAVCTVIAINLVWVADSLAPLFTGWVSLTGLGHALVLAQAAGVIVLAGLEYLGLRRVALRWP